MARTLKLPLFGLALLALLLVHSSYAADDSMGAKSRPRIGLVLSGGGARGLAHIGVLKVLETLRVPIDCIAGTSMGSLVAGAYAAGVSPEEMEAKVREIDWDVIFDDDPARTAIPFRQKRDDYSSYFDLELGLRGGRLLVQPGSTSGYKFEFFIRELIGPALGSNAMDFDQLPIPYRAVATDLELGTEKVFAGGDLARVMRASMSVPGVIAPVELGGHLYVDGGLVNNLPIDAARDMCADVIIAVNLGTPLMTRDQLQSVFAIAAQSVNLLTELNVKESFSSLQASDILIAPMLDDIGSGEFKRGLEAVPRGESAAVAIAEQLRVLSLGATEYEAWRRARAAKRIIPRTVTAFRFAPTQRVSPSVMQAELHLQGGEPFDQKVLHESLIRLFGRGDFERVGYHFEDEGPDRSVIVEPVEKSWGPDYVKLGLGLAGDLQSATRVSFGASHRKTWINRRGGEWRNDVQLGFANRASTEFFQPSSARRGSAFLAARAEYRSEPEIFFLEGRRIGEYDVSFARLHLEVGAQDHLGEFRIGAFTGNLRAKEDFGFLTFVPEYDLRQAGATVGFVYDQLDNADFPRHGLGAAGNLYSTQPKLGSEDDYDRAEFALQWAYTRGRHTVNPAVLIGDSLGTELPAYDVFQLGGFLRLSGYQTEELTGADYGLARVVYYYRYSSLPPQLGGGIYLGGSIEAGRIRDGLDAAISDKIQYGGSLFIGADTVLGPLRLAFGHAQGGNSSFYFVLGRVVPL